MKTIEPTELNFPSTKEIDGVLKKWTTEHSKAFDFNSDKRAVLNALKNYTNLLVKKNSFKNKPKYPLI